MIEKKTYVVEVIPENVGRWLGTEVYRTGEVDGASFIDVQIWPPEDLSGGD